MPSPSAPEFTSASASTTTSTSASTFMSTSTSRSMSREHDAVDYIPTSIAIVDDNFVTTRASEDFYNQNMKQLQQQHQQHHHQHHPHQYFSPYPSEKTAVNTNYYYPSSPDTRLSMSGSSTGSYTFPPQRATNWDPAPVMPLSPPPSSSVAAHSPQDEPSKLEAGVVSSDYYKNGRWSGQVSLSEGESRHGGHGRDSSRSVVVDGSLPVTVYAAPSDDKEARHYREPNAVLVLLLLSAPIPLFSICTLFYTFFALVLVVFTSPLRLCPPSAFFRATTFSVQLCKLLAPALRRHDRLAQSSSSPDRRHHHHCNSHSSSESSPIDQFSAANLILVLGLAPFLCVGLSLAVWVAAFFWIFAMILGNPDGTERKDDGRAAVLGVNRWWQTWLKKSRKISTA